MVVMVVQGTQLQKTFALGISLCEAKGNCTAEQTCELAAFEKNWPKPTGYHKDCTALDHKSFIDSYRLPLAIAGVLVVGGSSYFIRKTIVAKRRQRGLAGKTK